MLAELGRMRGAATLRKIGGRRQDMRLDAFQSPYAERTIRQQGNSQHKIERSEEHTSELQSLMSTSYAVFCLKKQRTCHTTGSSCPAIPHTPPMHRPAGSRSQEVRRPSTPNQNRLYQ